MPLSREEVLKKVATATVSGGGNNLRDGKYRAVLRKFEMADGFHGGRIVFEYVVVACKKKVGLQEAKTGKSLDIEPNAVGSDFSIVCMLEKHASAFGNVKEAILGLTGQTEMSEADFIDTMKDMLEGAGVGRMVDIDTYRKVTKENKVEIVLPKYFAIADDEQDIDAMKKWLTDLSEQQAEAAAEQAQA